MKYKYEYVEKDRKYGGTKSTTLGSFAHNALELYYLTPIEDRQPLINYFKQGCLNYISSSSISKDIDDSIISLMDTYAEGIVSLLKRSSQEYGGADKIRKKDGGIASNPSMTSEWKLSYEEMGLASIVDSISLYLNGKIDMDGSEFLDAYSEAKYICSIYKGSPYLEKAIAVEMPISQKKGDTILNQVKMPSKYGGRKDIYLLGYIDLVSELDDGSILIVDHKTSSSSFTGNDVRHNVQLLSYAYAYETIKGRRPDYIGINNVRGGGDLVFVETPSAKEGMEVLDSLFSAHKYINEGIWTKHAPEPYSPCLAMYGSPCPYLSKCWPSYLNN
jgi:hypothetical protein